MARRSRSSRHLAFRAKVILQCAEKTSTAVAQDLHTTNATVGKWRRRFVEQRTEGLYDEPRPGAPRKISDDKSEEVVTKTLESTPRGRTHWKHALDGEAYRFEPLHDRACLARVRTATAVFANLIWPISLI